MGRRRQEKRQRKELARILETVAKQARRQALEDAFETTARALFAEEAKDVQRLLEEVGPEETLELLDRLREEHWAPRWEATMRPLMEDVTRTQTGRRRGA